TMDFHVDVHAGAQQRRRRRPRLALAYSIAGEYHPDEAQLRMALAQLDQRATASDFDVIAVRTQTEDHTVRWQIGLESQHHAMPLPGERMLLMIRRWPGASAERYSNIIPTPKASPPAKIPDNSRALTARRTSGGEIAVSCIRQKISGRTHSIVTAE